MRVTLPAAPATADVQAGQGRALFSTPGRVALFGALLALVLSWSRLQVIWADNTFFDTDDAMRLVQVRDWLAGQGWYDLVQHRLHPPDGLLMHWSRVVDVPVGALIRLFELFTDTDRAERLARIVFPLGLQAALLLVGVRVARLLMGTAGMLPTMALLLLSGFTYEQFPPGRIDHHAPQIVLLLAMTGALLSSLAPGRERHAAVAGACVAVSLAISLENLPFIAVLLTVLPIGWLLAPRSLRGPMAWLAGSLVVAPLLMFVLTVPPERYLDPAADAFSILHLTALLSGAAALTGLAFLPLHRATGPVRRATLLAAFGGVAVAVPMLLWPHALHGPYATMDPELQRLWLDYVTEAQPLLVASRTRPDTFTMLFCPLVCGAVATGVATWRERGLARARWLVILVLTLVGMAGSLWEIRVVTSTQPVALLGGAWVMVGLSRRANNLGTGLLACVAALPFSTIGWALVPMPDGDAGVLAALQQGQACRSAAALAPVASLPAGLVFAPIDDGSHLLVATPHSVVAAPYHRNVAGNRAVLNAFMAPPGAAEAMVRRTGARYVAVCPGETEISVLARQAPDGLAAALVNGTPPAWLAPVPLAGTPVRVFALR